MKKNLLFILSMILVTVAKAQHCTPASVNITPISFGTPGLQPLPESLPCTVVGQPVSDTIYFQNFVTVSTFTMDSLKIDSIENLPPGLCWVTNKVSNTFAGGQSGAIYLSGTPTGPSGQYKIRIVADAYLSGLTLRNLDAEAATGLRYWIRTKCPTAVCTPLDTNSPYPYYIPYTSCPAPAVAIIHPSGAVNLCQGSSLVLRADTATGNSYKWSTGATSDTIVVSQSGTYSLTVTNIIDSAVSSPTVVTVVSLPQALVYPSGTVNICQGDSAIFSATTSGVSYAWSNGDTTQIIYPKTAGTYKLTVTDSHNCSAVSTTDTVKVNQHPPAVIIKNGFTLTAGSGTGYTYQWMLNDTPVTGHPTSISITATIDGSYTVLVTDSNYCSSISAAVVVSNVGIYDIASNTAIRLYPNPTEGLLTLETSGSAGDIYTISDELGRTVQQRGITADHMPVDMSTQPAGIYYLSIRHDAVSRTFRFAVVK